MTLRVLTRKIPRPLPKVAHLRYKGTDLFCAAKDIITTNVLTKFHEECYRPPPGSKISLLRKNACLPGGNAFQQTGTIFELIQDITTNVLNHFNLDLTINVTFRVLTTFYYSYIPRKAPSPHVFQQTETIFELIQDITRTNVLTKFHLDRTINVTSRVLTRKNAPPPGGHVFQPTGTILKIIQDIIDTNILQMLMMNDGQRAITKAHHEHNVQDWTINPNKRTCFQQTGTIFELVKDIKRTNVPTKFNEDWTINVISTLFTKRNALSPWLQWFSTNDIIETHILTNIHEDQTINVDSRVKNDPSLGRHVFQPIETIFELVQDIIGNFFWTKFLENQTTNVSFRVLTRKTPHPLAAIKFHDDQTINVAFRVLIRKNAPPPPPAWRPYIIATNLLTKFHEDEKNMGCPFVLELSSGNHLVDGRTNRSTCAKQYTPSSSKGGIISVASIVLTRQILTMDKR
ncbi:hypothetical protein DPMN_102373 [Dreissena polymorpha]|uniref:Uncharacterized protein n=1 Tax=Dreissena polymorpha TaxID=45954 RepID=A0A9D4LMS9_DREPO|nr:hypothetical protein DPMN_102373 [Dreissena polymorpha]